MLSLVGGVLFKLKALQSTKEKFTNEKVRILTCRKIVPPTSRKLSIQRTACVALVSIVLIVKIPGKVFFTVRKERGVKHTIGQIAKKVLISHLKVLISVLK